MIYTNVQKAQNSILYRVNILSQLFKSVQGDIIIVDDNNYNLFVSFLAATVSKKRLYVTQDNNKVEELILSNKIGLLIYDPNGNKRINLSYRLISNLDCHLKINSSKFMNSFDYNQWFTILGKLIKFDFPSYKDNMLTLDYIYRIINLTNKKLLTFYFSNKEYTYTCNNIWHALNAVDSEFKNHKYKIVDFSQSDFKSSFIYMLYFLKQHLSLDFGTLLTHIYHSKKDKRLIFVDKQNQKEIYNDLKHELIKPIIWNQLYERQILKPFRYLYNSILLKNKFNITRKDEVIFLNSMKNYKLNTITSESFYKFSYTFATQTTCNIFAINRFNDKKANIKLNEYRITSRDETLKYAINSLQQLIIHGKTTCVNQELEVSKNTSYNKEEYYNTKIYCGLNSDILTIKALEEDIYYDKNYQPLNIGYIKDGLLSLPYVNDAIILARYTDTGVKYTPVIEIDQHLIKKVFNRSDLMTIKNHLDNFLNDINTKNINLYGISIDKHDFFKNKDEMFSSDVDFVRTVANAIAR